jgi:hypothetical protein
MQEASECRERPYDLPISKNISNPHEALLPFSDAQREAEFNCNVPRAARHEAVRSAFK